MIESPASLAAKGMIRPTSLVWRIRLVFTDGSERVVCISPSRIDEAEAVSRAKTYAKIFDSSVLDRVEAEKVHRDLQATPFGMVQK